MTLEAGIHPDMDEAIYHADPCPEPSLSASIAQIIVEKSPRHALIAHPRLNANYAPEDSDAMDKGTAAHALLLNRGKSIEVVQAKDWRTKAAQMQRDAARLEGKVPVLEKDYAAAQQMVEAARDTLVQIEGCQKAFLADCGAAEVVAIWQEDNGIWCRAMFDWLASDGWIYDYKTGRTSANPQHAGKRAADMGWDVKAAWYERALKSQKIRFDLGMRFVMQENYPPYALSVVELDHQIMDYGRRAVEKAIATWHHCLANGHWPAYPTYVQRAAAPEWMMRQRLERELYAEEQSDRDREFAARAQAPL